MNFSESKLQTDELISNIIKDKFDQKKTPIEEVFHHSLHVEYILKFLKNLRISSSFDVQKSWLCYWGVNALAVLNELDELSEADRLFLAEYIFSFQVESGGFSGGQGYPANLVSTYASILALAILEVKEVNEKINLKGIESFILNCKGQIPGSYLIHIDGEVDLRCTFVAVLLNKMLNLENSSIEDGVDEYIASCQSFDGGISPVPSVEAHGGYTFCGLATMSLINKIEKLNVKKLMFWLINNQTKFGGFSGRTNKLVDSCYSFWQASSFHILQEYFDSNSEKSSDIKMDKLLYDNHRMQVYLVECCQGNLGGMKDKPGKDEDIYHTMYSLSGLALSTENECYSESHPYDWKNYFLEEMDPIYNIPRVKANKFIMFFREKNKQK